MGTDWEVVEEQGIVWKGHGSKIGKGPRDIMLQPDWFAKSRCRAFLKTSGRSVLLRSESEVDLALKNEMYCAVAPICQTQRGKSLNGIASQLAAMEEAIY